MPSSKTLSIRAELKQDLRSLKTLEIVIFCGVDFSELYEWVIHNNAEPQRSSD